MESKAKLLGHPVHPMLIVFPLGLLATAVAFDIVGLSTGDSSWFGISYWMIAAGIIGGLLSAIFGFIDWWAIPSGTRAKAIGTWHGVGNVIVVVQGSLLQTDRQLVDTLSEMFAADGRRNGVTYPEFST